MPPFAIVAVIIAFCSGVIRTSRWPMPDCASAAPSPQLTDRRTRPPASGSVRFGFSMPNAVPMARSLSAPIWSASCANGPLQDFANATENGTVGPEPQASPS